MKSLLKLLLINLLLLGSTSPVFSEPRTIRFATEATYPPFVSLSPSLHFEGFEVEIIKALCVESNIECTFSHLPFDSLFLGLSLKKIDAVFGGIAITAERKKQALFSNSLYRNAIGMVSLNTSPIHLQDKASFKGKIIAIQQGAAFQTYLQEKYGDLIQIKTYASIQDALLDLTTTRVDAVFGDVPVLQYWLKIKNHHHYKIQSCTDKEAQVFAQGNAIAMSKDEVALLQTLNKALETIKNNGTYEKIKVKWLDQNYVTP